MGCPSSGYSRAQWPNRHAVRRTYATDLAREKVPHVWLVDPDAKTLEVLELDGATYRLVATHGGEAVVRAVPFNAIELELADLWSE